MKKVLLVFIAIGLTITGIAQKSADIGIWGGTSTYFGDIREASPLQSFNLNVGAYFRYNFNARVAFRTMFLTGGFSSEGLIEDVPFSFKKNAQDLSAMVEINYLKYVLGEKKTPFTPYIFGGVGVMYFPYTNDADTMLAINPGYPLRENIDESVVTLTIPFGMGVKFSLGKRFGIGAEYQMRKLLSDKFDNIDDPLSFEKELEDGSIKTISYNTLLHNNDWAGYLGIHLTYKLYLDQRDCPAYDRKYW